MDEFKNLSLNDLLDELIDCGREKQIFGDSERGSTRDIADRISYIKEEITRRFYSGEKMK